VIGAAPGVAAEGPLGWCADVQAPRGARRSCDTSPGRQIR